MKRAAGLLLLTTIAPAWCEVTVTRVDPGQAAASSGLQSGDVIRAVRVGDQVVSLDWPIDLLRAEENLSRFEGATLVVHRQDATIDLSVPPGRWGLAVSPGTRSPSPQRTQWLARINLLGEGKADSGELVPGLLALTDTSWGAAMQWQAGNVLAGREEWESADRLWRAALAQTSDPGDRALLKRRLGRSALGRGQAGESMGLFRESLDYWTGLSAPIHAMVLNAQIGFAAFENRDLETAEAAFVAAVDVARDWQPLHPDAVSALRGLGQVRAVQGRYPEAVALGEEALERATQLAPGTVFEAKALSFLGVTTADRGNVAEGEQLLMRAIDIADRLAPDGINAAGFRNNLALVYYWRHDYALARELYEQALERFQRRKPISAEVARTRYNIALTYSRENKNSEAAEAMEEVLAIQRELVPGTEDEARTLHTLAIQYDSAGQVEAAIRAESEALALYRKILPSSYRLATSAHKLGQIYLRNERLDEAGPLLREALDLARREVPDSRLQAEAAFDLGLQHDRTGAPEPALALYREAVETIESLQARLGGGDSALSAFRAYYGHFFKRLVEAELRAGDPEAAFAVSERYRAQSLLALMASRPAALAQRLPPELQEHYQAARRTYQQALKAVSRDDLPTNRTALDAARRDWQMAADRVRAESSAGELIAPRVIDSSDLSSRLGAGELLLSYVVHQSHTDVFGIFPDDTLRHIRLETGRQAIADRVRRARVLISVPDAGPASAEALQSVLLGLGEVLIEPVNGWLADAEKLIVVPDAELWLLPFAAVRTAGGYLVERHQTQMAWSATAYGSTVSARETSRNPHVVAIADPTAGFPGDAGPEPVRAGPSVLPGSRREVARIGELFPDATLLTDRQATETALINGAQTADILHIAAHAVALIDPPLESYFQLSPDEENDGRLMTWEVLAGLNLNSELVILSGCATALGEGAAGEGLMGLTRAFGVAGARRVLASLWPVSDTATAGLMGKFYGARSANVDDSAALREAQLAVLSPGWGQRLRSLLGGVEQRHPFYWAAFSLYGGR